MGPVPRSRKAKHGPMPDQEPRDPHGVGCLPASQRSPHSPPSLTQTTTLSPGPCPAPDTTPQGNLQTLQALGFLPSAPNSVPPPPDRQSPCGCSGTPTAPFPERAPLWSSLPCSRASLLVICCFLGAPRLKRPLGRLMSVCGLWRWGDHPALPHSKEVVRTPTHHAPMAVLTKDPGSQDTG